MAQIKGSSIRGALRFVKESGYAGGTRALVARLPSTVRPIFDRPILAGSWYPYEAFGELLATVDAELGRGDRSLMRQLGHDAAKKDVSGAFQFVRIFTSLSKIAPKAHTFWPRVCDSGRFELLEAGDDFTVSALFEFPDIHPCHCEHLAGWLEGMCLAMHAESASATHSRCVHRGDDCCAFDVRWVE